MQERQILFRIALTRALYDQMAPQLCPFYVPGKLSFSSLVFVLIFRGFLMSGKHLPEESTTPICQIHIVFILGPTQTSFSFPPAGTPEAASWEQEQMARPHFVKLNFVWRVCGMPRPTYKISKYSCIVNLRIFNFGGSYCPVDYFHH